MIQTTLAFEKKRRSGQPPQLALYIQLINSTLVLSAAGVEGLDAGVLYKADGSKKADGSITAGELVHTVARSLLSLEDLSLGEELAGDPNAPRVTVMPSRKGTTRAVIDNTTGLLGELMANEPFLGKAAEVRLTYPGLTLTDMPTAFSGEVAGEEIGEHVVLDLRSA